MERHANVAKLEQILHELVGVLLLVDEDDDVALLGVNAEQLEELEELLVVLENGHVLLDVRAHRSPGANSDLDRLCEDTPREQLHRTRKRGREEHCLPVGPDAVHHHIHLRLEAHVEHSVCLVQHNVCASPQIHYLRAQI